MACVGLLTKSLQPATLCRELKVCCSVSVASPLVSQTRSKANYVNWHMWKDLNRRRCVQEHAVEKLRVNALKRNNVLPQEIRELASDQMTEDFPRNAHHRRLVNRCVMTSRPRGVLPQWRLSRIMFRHLADYNKLSGVTRSSW